MLYVVCYVILYVVRCFALYIVLFCLWCVLLLCKLCCFVCDVLRGAEGNQVCADVVTSHKTVCCVVRGVLCYVVSGVFCCFEWCVAL